MVVVDGHRRAVRRAHRHRASREAPALQAGRARQLGPQQQAGAGSRRRRRAWHGCRGRPAGSRHRTGCAGGAQLDLAGVAEGQRDAVATTGNQDLAGVAGQAVAALELQFQAQGVEQAGALALAETTLDQGLGHAAITLVEVHQAAQRGLVGGGDPKGQGPELKAAALGVQLQQIAHFQRGNLVGDLGQSLGQGLAVARRVLHAQRLQAGLFGQAGLGCGAGGVAEHLGEEGDLFHDGLSGAVGGFVGRWLVLGLPQCAGGLTGRCGE